ncbi:MAG TPA: DNA-directed RNA polymerase subunit beta' [Dehalococcoidia bacterium]|nr:DNA-directed RNA polymerase subunit beta' [Dehalococcoidia bacterium]
MAEVNDFNAIRISLASPDQIKSWSYGEVTEPETINYRTLKPEKDGLFCERIFGPTKNFECYCGKYKKIRYRGITCDRCGVTVEHSRVRRTRMGHIELAAPVAHIWFAKSVPSRIALLLDISPRDLERVLYFAQYIITSVDQKAVQDKLAKIKAEYNEQLQTLEKTYTAKIQELEGKPKSKNKKGADAGESEQEQHLDQKTIEAVNKLQTELAEKKTELNAEFQSKTGELENLAPMKRLSESQYQDYIGKYSSFFEASMGAEAILKILRDMNLEEIRQQLVEDIKTSEGQRRKKFSKRLRVVEAFWRSGNKPEWMIMIVLPVLPPELRPIVQLDGGRFATSDLNDLYRRVINRNNRLKRLIELGAPEIIVNNEKRMLQESVDALIDNGRRGRASTAGNAHKLKSLSDMLRGKQGRFRQNLLGKRVDYSGRSVIVCGPELKLHQCGLPKHMALELFKPFIMRRLVEQGYAHNIKSARRQVERARPEVWEILKEAVKERPVMLNRAPTLHRLSIQAFEPVLIDGSAIQLHPLVCSAFNADFDGDQMAVHLPLSRSAVKEARTQMLSTRNMLLPSSGDPVMTPTLDMVLGCYYLTNIKPTSKEKLMHFSSFEEAKLAYNLKSIELNDEIEVKLDDNSGNRIKTSVGRILFNEILPAEIRRRHDGFYNQKADKSALKKLVSECFQVMGNDVTAIMLDNLKRMGFEFATKSGTSIAAHDIQVPDEKQKILSEGDERVAVIDSQYNRGLITEDERYTNAIEVWTETTERIRKTIEKSLDRYGGIYMMATSGAKGNISQITQMAGMRGLMTDPAGRIIDFPIKASFREGLSVMEYFMSTHGARKGLADTALRTSDAGYLTRRLIDVAQDLIILEEDCGTDEGIWMSKKEKEGELLTPLFDRILGRLAAADVVDEKTGEIIVHRNEEIDDEKIKILKEAEVNRIYVRSPLSCHAKRGICQKCYGRDLARRGLVKIGTAVGIIAAQSIGEPGTQLTLRTFHTGGVVGADITSGLPRVEELVEARIPKGVAALAEIDGTIEVSGADESRKVVIRNSETYLDEYPLPPGYSPIVSNGDQVQFGQAIAVAEQSASGQKQRIKAKTGEIQEAAKTKSRKKVDTTSLEKQPITARFDGKIATEHGRLYIQHEEQDEREYRIPAGSHLRFKTGDTIKAGEQLYDGTSDPQEILRISGRDAIQHYLVSEIQKVYRSQGVSISDKHIEVIIRQMLRRVRIENAGDTELLSGDLIDRFEYESINAKTLAEGGDPATAQTVLLGITRASLNTGSWLAAASFQETTKVLTEAAIWGKTDKLLGLKENVIIGRLIPAQSVDVSDVQGQLPSGITTAVLEPLPDSLAEPPIEEQIEEELVDDSNVSEPSEESEDN